MKKILLSFLIVINFYLLADDFILIDVRTIPEFNNGHIETSINIQWENIDKILGEVEKDSTIYLYCRSGNRSNKATRKLIDLGYKNVKNIGGIKEASEFLGLNIVN